eukprot:6201466-Pleurochrysis_carterae.AAC.1
MARISRHWEYLSSFKSAAWGICKSWWRRRGCSQLQCAYVSCFQYNLVLNIYFIMCTAIRETNPFVHLLIKH